MTGKEALAELIAKVEAGATRVTVEEAAFAVWPKNFHAVEASAAYNGSLDAAKALHEAVLPGWFAGVSENIYGHGWHGWVQTRERSMDALSDDPARAWLLAILRALHSMETDT